MNKKVLFFDNLCFYGIMKIIEKSKDVKMKKVFIRLFNILRNNYIYIFGVILLTYKALLMNKLLGMNIEKEMYIITMAVPMVIMFPSINKKGKRSFIFANIVYFICSILIYANYIYYNYSTNFLSVFQIENVKYAEEIGISLQYLINLKSVFIFFIDNVVFLTLSILILKYRKKDKLMLINKRYPKYIILILIIILNIVILNKKIDGAYEDYIYNKTLMVEHISIYYYHLEDIKDYIKESFIKEKVDYSKINQIYEQNKKDKSVNTNFTGIAQGKNVIILQLESINEFVINSTIDGKEITPNLNKFYKENIYFTNMYNQGIGTTADSEHTILTSMYPLENGRVFQKYFSNKWFDMYSQLKENGYYTSFMHPNVNTFWNRYLVYNTGYKIDEYNDISHFDSNGEMAGEFFSDEQFLTQAVYKMESYEKPFICMMSAISTHIPYSLEGISNLDEKLSIDVSNVESDEISRYLLACNFVDYSFGKFMEEIENTDLLENSILIVYGDHGAGLQNLETVETICKQNGKDYNENIENLLNVHIPFGMKIPNFEARVIENSVSKIDIKPTIMNLLNIEDKFSIGTDVFSGKDYSFIKGIGYVTKENYYINGEYFNRSDNNVIKPNDELIRLMIKMSDEMFLSDTIIKNNLISRILK